MYKIILVLNALKRLTLFYIRIYTLDVYIHLTKTVKS